MSLAPHSGQHKGMTNPRRFLHTGQSTLVLRNVNVIQATVMRTDAANAIDSKAEIVLPWTNLRRSIIRQTLKTTTERKIAVTRLFCSFTIRFIRSALGRNNERASIPPTVRLGAGMAFVSSIRGGQLFPCCSFLIPSRAPKRLNGRECSRHQMASARSNRIRRNSGAATLSSCDLIRLCMDVANS